MHQQAEAFSSFAGTTGSTELVVPKMQGVGQLDVEMDLLRETVGNDVEELKASTLDVAHQETLALMVAREELAAAEHRTWTIFTLHSLISIVLSSTLVMLLSGSYESVSDFTADYASLEEASNVTLEAEYAFRAGYLAVYTRETDPLGTWATNYESSVARLESHFQAWRDAVTDDISHLRRDIMDLQFEFLELDSLFVTPSTTPDALEETQVRLTMDTFANSTSSLVEKLAEGSTQHRQSTLDGNDTARIFIAVGIAWSVLGLAMLVAMQHLERPHYRNVKAALMAVNVKFLTAAGRQQGSGRKASGKVALYESKLRRTRKVARVIFLVYTMACVGVFILLFAVVIQINDRVQGEFAASYDKRRVGFTAPWEVSVAETSVLTAIHCTLPQAGIWASRAVSAGIRLDDSAATNLADGENGVLGSLYEPFSSLYSSAQSQVDLLYNSTVPILLSFSCFPPLPLEVNTATPVNTLSATPTSSLSPESLARIVSLEYSASQNCSLDKANLQRVSDLQLQGRASVDSSVYLESQSSFASTLYSIYEQLHLDRTDAIDELTMWNTVSIASVSMLVPFTVLCMLLLYRMQHRQRRLSKRVGVRKEWTLARILNNKRCRSLFLHHATMCYTQESVLFWWAVEMVGAAGFPVKNVITIRDRFIAQGSQHEVNLTQQMRSDVQHMTAKYHGHADENICLVPQDAELLRQVQGIIFRMMEKDLLEEFLDSTDFHEFLNQRQKMLDGEMDFGYL